MPTWVVMVLLEDDLLALNRAVGIVRRRNLALSGLTYGPTPQAGTMRLVFVVTGDAAATERMANHFRKMSEVRTVTVHPASDCTAREHALARVRVAPVHLSALLDAVALFEARVVEESAHDVVVEATGSAPFMVSFLRALEGFGIVELVRSSPLSLPPRAVPGAATAPIAPAVAAPRVPSAISA